MAQAAIWPDMSEEAHLAYLDLINEFVSSVHEPVVFEATGYRYGPAAGGDEAWINIVLQDGANLLQWVTVVVSTVAWLRRMGADEIYVSERGIEALGKAELARRGHGDAEVVSIGQLPGRGETPWGTPRRHGGFAAVYRLPDQRLAVLLYTADGMVLELSLTATEHPPSGTER